MMTEVTTQIDTIPGLRAYAFDPGSVVPPAALVGWPDRLDYAGTYGRGCTRVPDLPVLVVVSRATERTAAKRLGEYVAEAGTNSVPAKVMARAGSWVACDVVTVTSAEFLVATVGGIAYLAAEFHLDVTGKGV